MFIARKFKLIVLLFGSLALAACGSSSGGGGGIPNAGGLATGIFTKTVIQNGANGDWGYPFDSTFGPESRFQMLYRASDINGSGMISSISFQRELANATDILCPNITIRMGHTPLPDLTATFANNIEQGRGSFEIVLDNKTVSALAGAAGDYFDINLDTPFNYNGVDNIVVEIDRPVVCDTDGLKIDTTLGLTPYVAVVNSTTSGAATGTPNNYPPHIKFNFTGGNNNMNYAAVTAGTVPFSVFASERHGQMLHDASSINGSGPITGIAMISNAPSTTQTYTVNIKLGHTTLSTLTDTFANNFNSGSPVTVATAVTFTVPAGIPAGSPIWLPITGSFTYNGIDNLIVDIEVTAATGGIDWARDDNANHRLYAAVGDTMGTLTNGGSHTVFRFNGGTMDVGQPSTAAMSEVFDGTVDGAAIQNLYRPVDLGTGGRINSVGVRLDSDSMAAVYSNYTIRMGHTAKTALNSIDTFASNMDEDMTVYSGSFSIPAGLKAGDWVTIPLDTEFNYDPTRNLVILFSSLGGAASGNNVLVTGGVRFLSSISGGNAGSDTVPTMGVENGIVVTRLHIQK